MKVNWITINTADLEKSKEFYGEYLGLALEREFSPYEGMRIAFFAADNFEIELLERKGYVAAEGANTGLSVGITPDNYDEILAGAHEKGILEGEPEVVGGHLTCFFIHDPNGVRLQVIKA